VRSARARAEADWDARGTLGVGRDAPVGLRNIRLRFELDTDTSDEDLPKLAERTERYCVVAATLKAESPVDAHVALVRATVRGSGSPPFRAFRAPHCEGEDNGVPFGEEDGWDISGC